MKKQLTSGKTQCKTCGAFWGTTGHQRKCPQKEYTYDGKFCDCGEPATTASAITSRPDPVCQRCYDIEKNGYRAIAGDSTPFGETYRLRLPNRNS